MQVCLKWSPLIGNFNCLKSWRYNFPCIYSHWWQFYESRMTYFCIFSVQETKSYKKFAHGFECLLYGPTSDQHAFCYTNFNQYHHCVPFFRSFFFLYRMWVIHKLFFNIPNWHLFLHCMFLSLHLVFVICTTFWTEKNYWMFSYKIIVVFLFKMEKLCKKNCLWWPRCANKFRITVNFLSVIIDFFVHSCFVMNDFRSAMVKCTL